MTKQFDNQEISVGVVGLGLMGTSIAVALLIAGHKVIGIAPMPGEKEKASFHIKDQLKLCEKDGLLTKSWEIYLSSLIITDNYKLLNDCNLVLECVVESVEIKESVYKNIVPFINSDTIIGSNTSAVPISLLQQYVTYPERFIGIHWAEPAFATRFMEIICGSKTSIQTAEWVFKLANNWGKEPTILKKDIRGFITNRLMYAVYREALHLVENGEATIEDTDKAFRYDAGSWMTLMGVFRRMDFLGLSDYWRIFKNLMPGLNNSDEVPKLMQHLVDINALGIRNGKGLYEYSIEEANDWEEAFTSFNKDIYQLASMYPSKPVDILLQEQRVSSQL